MGPKSLTRDRARVAALGVQSPSHWTTREVPQTPKSYNLNYLWEPDVSFLLSLPLNGHWNVFFEGSSPYGEGDGTPLQYSCLENPMDGGAWWAASMGSLGVGYD